MRTKGFTLIEVLIAMVILGVGLLALTTMSTVYVQANVKSQDLTAGALLGRYKMEQLRQYATAQPDNQSVFGFDYLVSTAAVYSSVVDPPNSAPAVVHTVSGLLSGAAGTPYTSTAGAEYGVLFDDGTNGDAVAGDGTYTNQDTPPVTGATVTRRWSVRPLNADFAEISVESSWTDKFGVAHRETCFSLASRRK